MFWHYPCGFTTETDIPEMAVAFCDPLYSALDRYLKDLPEMLVEDGEGLVSKHVEVSNVTLYDELLQKHSITPEVVFVGKSELLTILLIRLLYPK